MRRDERGVVVIMYAIALTGIVTVAAMVLDLSQLRSDRRINKGVADSAVRAGLGVLQAGPWSGVCRARGTCAPTRASRRSTPAVRSGSS